MIKALLLGTMALAAMPAFADTPSAKLASDIRVQESRNQIIPADSGSYVELAQSYLRAGRTGDAVFAYRAALKRDNEMMLTKNGDSIWSHDVARKALALIPQYAAR